MIEEPKIIDFPKTRLIGAHVSTSFINDRTSETWRGFRPIMQTIPGRIGNESFSVKIYDASYSFSSFDPTVEFEKWAAVAVSDNAAVPDGLEPLTLPAGTYAEFTHVGLATTAPRIFGYIFGQWLPASPYELDLRPHLEILPPGYDPFDENATERVFIPTRPKS